MPDLDIEQMRADMAAGKQGPWAVVKRDDFITCIKVAKYADDYTEQAIARTYGHHTDARRIARVPDMESRILSDADTIAALSAEVSRLRKNAERIDRLHTACGVLSESAEPDICDNGNGHVVISAFEFVQFEAFLSDYSALKENADG